LVAGFLTLDLPKAGSGFLVSAMRVERRGAMVCRTQFAASCLLRGTEGLTEL
jgi:hypothetical protein